PRVVAMVPREHSLLLRWPGMEILVQPLLGLAVGAPETVVAAGGDFVLVSLLVMLPDEQPGVFTTVSPAVVFLCGASGSAADAYQHRIDSAADCNAPERRFPARCLSRTALR